MIILFVLVSFHFLCHKVISIPTITEVKKPKKLMSTFDQGITLVISHFYLFLCTPFLLIHNYFLNVFIYVVLERNNLLG